MTNIKHAFTILSALFYTAAGYSQTEFRVSLFDTARNRPVPVAVYQPPKEGKHTKVVIFNHGYDENKNSNANGSYSYLTRFLAEKGYYVISIQHELPGDPLLAMDGNFMETRMPNWERGVENILFAISEFKKLKPGLDWKNVTVIGHSNGGDMAMLLAAEHPGTVVKSISLDHRRMIMPRVSNPRIYTIRGCNYDADPGVIPSAEEQSRYGITVIKADGITHSDMGQRGSKEQHELINSYIYGFLKQ